MGANFAPSYANLTMAYWEENYIWHNNRFGENIVYYGRFIDNIIIIWEGPLPTVENFVSFCNNNSLGLSFISVTDSVNLPFLDLELYHINHTIHAKNHSKPTAGNSFLHYSSCHHTTWKNNIPKGQYCRLRQNCTNHDDYKEQSLFLKTKFKDKGYPDDLVESGYNQYFNKEPSGRTNIFFSMSTRFITRFHRKMESIVQKYWTILKSDPHLQNSIQNKV